MSEEKKYSEEIFINDGQYVAIRTKRSYKWHLLSKSGHPGKLISICQKRFPSQYNPVSKWRELPVSNIEKCCMDIYEEMEGSDFEWRNYQ